MMKIAMLAPIAWRTPPRHYGPWESIVSLISEELVRRGISVTLFATKDSFTRGELRAICERGYEEDKRINPKVWECLHVSEVFEQADAFDIIHNHFDFLPLTYSAFVETPLLTTIHGFSSAEILPVYEKYNGKVHYVSISNSDRSEKLNYLRTVYHGIDLSQFEFNADPEDYLIFFGRIHHDKGTWEAIEIAKRIDRKLVIAGLIQDEQYFETKVKPHLDEEQIVYLGSVGSEERNKILRNGFALLHPINFDEPFGLSVVESMACGTPVIAYKRGSMPELVIDGKTGYLVPQSVDQAAAAVGKIEQIDRRSCREVVEKKFSVERMVDDYVSVYKEILGID